METLKKDWLTEGLLDFEYKKYILLAYLQDIHKNFNRVQLYPCFSELLFHYRNLKRVSENKELLIDQFPKQLTSADFKKFKLNYALIVEDDEVMKVIQELIEFALPRMTEMLEEGKEIHDFVREQLAFETIGVTPIYDQEGYLLLKLDTQREVSVYRYKVSIFQDAKDQYRGVNTTYVGQEMTSISRTFETIKYDLTKSYQELPNPNTILVVSKMDIPVEATLLPVSKQWVMRHVTVNQ